jgi:hypothetical protein
MSVLYVRIELYDKSPSFTKLLKTYKLYFWIFEFLTVVGGDYCLLGHNALQSGTVRRITRVEEQAV